MKGRHMNYYILQLEDTNDYKIVERQTDNIIYIGSKTEAQSLMCKLNLGQAFDGWTPSFFLKWK